MPESKGRKPKKKAAPKRPARRRIPGPQALPNVPFDQKHSDRTVPPRPDRDPAREIPAEDRYELPELPEPASYLQVLHALSKLDPLSQETMIAARLGAMPAGREGGMPVNVPRMVRPSWAHHLRKLGIFCIPELATHELVAADNAGMMINHTADTLRKLEPEDMWEKVKAMDPSLGQLVDEAKTPEQKRQAMQILMRRLPAEHRIAVDKLMSTASEELEPT